jgi:flagellar motor protein MotB
MRSQALLRILPGIFCTGALWAQSQPLYRVTVVERTIPAVNYQYRTGPTQIDFRGTVLLADATGGATVESKSGRTEIDAHFEHLADASRFGAEYLTYVLWAITPQGNAKSLGEVLANGSDKAHLRVTTDLQAFGLIVTAEPFSAVRMPSDVVVMENQVRPDTIGDTQPIHARYELMPRGSYTYNVTADLKAEENAGSKVSMADYEKLVELYQAQNALQIAESQGADQYAPEIMAKAREEYRTAHDLEAHKGNRSAVVSAARAAAETAEDARIVATKRKQDAELTQAKDQAAHEQQLRIEAQAEAQRARSQAEADRSALDQATSQIAAAQEAEAQAHAQASAAATLPPPPPPVQQSRDRMGPTADNQAQTNLRMTLLQQLNGTLNTVDTPRGLVVTVPESEIHGSDVGPAASSSLARLASMVAAHPGLTVEVEGYSDNANSESDSYHRAIEVREALIRNGLAASSVSARGLGNSRPVASNATSGGREQNRRVEIVIAGEPIGAMASWDKPYAVTPAK